MATISIKVLFGDDIRKCRLADTSKLGELVAKCRALGAPPGVLGFSYVDEDGDKISIKTDADWEEAKASSLEGGNTTLKITVAAAARLPEVPHVAMQIAFRGGIHELRLPATSKLGELVAKCRALGAPPGVLGFSYVDEDGDKISIKTDADWEEAKASSVLTGAELKVAVISGGGQAPAPAPAPAPTPTPAQVAAAQEARDARDLDEALRRSELVYVYVDISNVELGTKMAIHPGLLTEHVVAGRTLERAFAVGSAARSDVVATTARWGASGIDTKIQVRAPGMGEQFVDEAIIANIADALQTYGSCKVPGAAQRTLVLLTGDGNDNGGRASFFKQVQFAVAAGWKVEVRCWSKGVSSRYTKMAERGEITLVPLDGGAEVFCRPVGGGAVAQRRQQQQQQARRSPSPHRAARHQHAVAAAINKPCFHQERCIKFGCPFVHPAGRRKDCRAGAQCTRQATCWFLHPKKSVGSPRAGFGPSPSQQHQHQHYGGGGGGSGLSA